MTTLLQSLPATCFSSCIPDVIYSFTPSSGDIDDASRIGTTVTITIDGKEIFSERFFPVDGKITLAELDRLLTPYARQNLSINLTIEIEEDDDVREDGEGTATISSKIIYCEADINTSATDFINTHFLTMLDGEKQTALNRLEYLHYIGTDSASVVAEYDDGTTKTFKLSPVGGNGRYTTIDVTPSKFVSDTDSCLLGFWVQAGQRKFRFSIDLDEPDCAPILVFENSFGCDELLYCTGTHTVAPTYKRSQGYIGKFNRNYEIAETRTFKADTGFLTFAMANWADELFRSKSIHVVNFKDGHPNVGKEVIVTDSKSEYNNNDESMPRFTFSYQYAQRNHNVFDTLRSGRIFDNTFDNTFE